METISFKEKNRRDHSFIVCCGHTLVWYLSLISTTISYCVSCWGFWGLSCLRLGAFYPVPGVWLTGDKRHNDAPPPFSPPNLSLIHSLLPSVRSQKLRMLSYVDDFDSSHVLYVYVRELWLRESTKSLWRRRVSCTSCPWLRNLIIFLETLAWLLCVCCVFSPPPTLFIRIFLLQVFVAFTGKKKFEVRRRLAAKIYENWTAFQCFSPHVMLISFSKGSWLNFLFRNRRIFWIETFVIYKLGRLSALPVQQASRWDALYVELSITMCLVWFSFGWSTVKMVQWYLYFISKCSPQQFLVCDGLRLKHIVVIMPKTT